MPFKNKRQIRVCFAAHDPNWDCKKWLKITPKNIPESFKSWLENTINEHTKEEFWNLADEQRGSPEHAMLKVQHIMQGGVLNPVIEHVGDLIHRMAERPTFGYAGYGYVKEKVEKVLRWMTNGYGFKREVDENIVNNAKYLNIPLDEYKRRLFAAMDNYANEHEKLRPLNRAQKLAQIAAVSVGRRQYNKAIAALRMLETHLVNQDEWVNFAHQGLDA
jgi:hypothetical protein